MRRYLILAACGLVLAGCGGGKTVSPLPQTVVGTVAKAPTVKGNAAAGKAVFTGQGCSSCHTFTPAAAHATVGPNLDKLATYAAQFHQPVAAFTQTQITHPDTYHQSGYPTGVMPTTYSSLSPQQLADLVAFLTQKS